MEGIEDFEEDDLNSTTYSQFAADLAGDKEIFASSFSSNRNNQTINSIKEEPEFHTTPSQHSQSFLQISRVSSVFDGIDGLQNNEDLGLNFSDSSWVREFGESEHVENTFTSQDECPAPVLKNTSQTIGRKKTVKRGNGSKRKICDTFWEVKEDKEIRSGVNGRKLDAPVSSISHKSIHMAKKALLNKEKKSDEETRNENPKRRKIILKEKNVKLSFSCNFCSKSFSSKIQLNGHQKMHKNTSSSDPCGLCGKTFRLKKESKRHEYTHMTWDQLQKTRRFHAKCYFCKDQRIFLNYRDYGRHLNTHTEEKPYSCNTCSKRFAHPSNLKRHEVVHSKAKRFKCKKCGKRFTLLQSLKSHDLIHMDKSNREKIEKSWKNECEFCKIKFRTPYLLKLHTPTHTGEKKFTCSHCHQTFTQKGNMLRHEKSQH